MPKTADPRHQPFVKPDPHLMDLAINHISSYYPLPKDLEDKIRVCLFEAKVRKNEYLLKQGEISEYLYFIIKGLVVGYTTLKNKKLTTYICLEGESVSAIKGMYGEGPSGESIYAVEDSHLIGLPISNLLEWLETSFEMNIIIRKIVESFYKSAHQRSNLVRMGTAQEKYEFYLSTTNHNIQRIPPQYIADLLDIKPETLSKILKKTKEPNEALMHSQCEIIENYMLHQQAFKQHGLTLSKMAADIKIPAHQLSHILNFHYKKSFSSFVNCYRVNYVRNKLQNISTWQHLTIEGIGKEGGFSSRSAFFAEFKLHTGMTPSEYARSGQN
nr:helix-turn-helix domain-containing protein [Pedobacter panaciterrae]